MNDTPTPRTDAESFLSRGMGIVPTLPKEAVRIDFARTLERELTAVTEQRDGLRSGIDYASDQLAKVTEQRDRLAEDLNKMISICSCETEDIDTVNEIRYFVDTITKHSNP